MLGLNPSMRFYLCEGPVDMRKGIFTLAELVRKIYQLHDSFCIRVILTAIYKFPFYMLQARDACDMGISIAFEFPVR